MTMTRTACSRVVAPMAMKCEDVGRVGEPAAVIQAQRDLLQAQVNLLQTTLDYESSLVNFEAVQQAPPLAAGDTVGLSGADIVPLPTPSPRGLFRPGSGGGF
jgi:hypothetical protein